MHNSPREDLGSKPIISTGQRDISVALSSTCQRVSKLSTALDEAIAQLRPSVGSASNNLVDAAGTEDQRQRLETELNRANIENRRLAAELSRVKQESGEEIAQLRKKLTNSNRCLQEAIAK